MFALAMMLPWVLCVGISALFFAKSAKDGLFIGIYLAIGFIFWGILIYIGLFLLLGEALGSAAIVDGLFAGLTDLHPVLAVILSSLEGGLIGGAFGAFVGSLKYKPTQESYTPSVPEDKGAKKEKKEKTKKGKNTSDMDSGPTLSPDQLKKCPFCGKMIKKDLKYCINCENFLG